MLMVERDSIGRWLEAAGLVPVLTAAEELHLGAKVSKRQDLPGGSVRHQLKCDGVVYGNVIGLHGPTCG
jgi:hypothetical protein